MCQKKRGAEAPLLFDREKRIDQPRQDDGMYLSGAPVQLQSAVLPFQLGDNCKLMAPEPTALFASMLTVPSAKTVPLSMNFVEAMGMFELTIDVQPLFSWQTSVTAVRAPEAPSITSVIRDRMV